ncbi:MAG: Alkaline phosphatase synthesis transcriptional regulatory protein PhoP, partial [Acidobacteria bacterium]|nr:Alkaline phosphatase synthesis transcriptional regulatory protein PhoP [Acidobacteriota bacterium]
RAFPRMSFEELQQMGSATAPAAPELPAPEPSSPWDEPAAFAGETRAFPKMSFEEMQQMASPGAAEPRGLEPVSPWDEPAGAPEPAAAGPAWSTEAHEEAPEPVAYATGAQSYETPAFETAAYEAPEAATEGNETGHGVTTTLFAAESYAERFVADSYEPEPYSSESYGNASTAPVAEPESEESPFASGEELASAVASPAWPSTADEPDPTAAYEAAESYPTAVNPQITDAVADAASEVVGAGVQLSEAQLEQIARRVVELMSEQVVRSIAWEVIPDVAQMMVKERIRQLESEA